MLMRVANWYGEQAATCYQRYMRTDDKNDLRDYCRYALLADKLWKEAK